MEGRLVYLEVTSLQGCSFQIGGLAYDNKTCYYNVILLRPFYVLLCDLMTCDHVI